MRTYRYPTGPGDSDFYHRVSEAVSGGWELAGPSTLVYDAISKRIVCNWPLAKERLDIAYSREIDSSVL